MKRSWILRPFEMVAGYKALAIGSAGMAVCVLLSWATGQHLNGMLQFRIDGDPLLWHYAAEHIVIWLAPSIFFLLGGLMLSRSKIRVVDVAGTVAFSQLPLLGIALMSLLKPVRAVGSVTPRQIMDPSWIQQPAVIAGLVLTMVSVVFIVWMCIWMFNALKVSCNLKGGRLVTLYIITLLFGEFVCRWIIGSMYVN